MPMLDVFNSDAYGVVSLTTAINKLPFKPARLGGMGLFKKSGIMTTGVVVEERHGKLVLVPNVGRGASPNVLGGTPRKGRSFTTTHLPLSSAVMADDVQNVRAFGSESAIETVAGLVNDKLSDLRQSIEFTQEFHRVGAVQGILLDADGTTTIYNWFTEFSITKKQVTIDWADTNGIKTVAAEIIRHIQDSLGMTPYQRIHVMVGDALFDSLTIAPETKVAYDRWNEGQFLRENQTRRSFEYGQIMWENYRGKVGATPFFPTATGWAFPVGAPNIFAEVYAPANYVETVNTRGQAVYAKQERMKFDIGVELQAQSNPLIYCARPSVLVEVLQTGTPPT